MRGAQLAEALRSVAPRRARSAHVGEGDACRSLRDARARTGARWPRCGRPTTATRRPLGRPARLAAADRAAADGARRHPRRAPPAARGRPRAARPDARDLPRPRRRRQAAPRPSCGCTARASTTGCGGSRRSPASTSTAARTGSSATSRCACHGCSAVLSSLLPSRDVDHLARAHELDARAALRLAEAGLVDVDRAPALPRDELRALLRRGTSRALPGRRPWAC